VPVGLARYGVPVNPFRTDELNPLLHGISPDLLARVDGFQRIDEIGKHVKKAAEQREPVFLMIAGGSGSGRTSVANHVLACYAHHRGLLPERLIVPPNRIEYQTAGPLFKKWVGFLRNAIQKLKVPIPMDLKRDIASLSQRNPDTPDFQDVVQRVGDLLRYAKGGEAAFAVMLEDVESYEIVTAALEIFDDVPTICIFTALNYQMGRARVVRPFDVASRKSDNQWLIELSKLGGAEARQLVEHRWASVSPTTAPIDLQGVQEVFSDRARATVKVVSFIGVALEQKLADKGEGDEWPAAPELFISADELRNRMESAHGLSRFFEDDPDV
jgi:hypothetical protein